MEKALERSRALERHALERTQDYRLKLELFREFGADVFGTGQEAEGGEAAADAKTEAEEPDVAADADLKRELDEKLGAAIKDVLIGVELNLGPGVGKAMLAVAPWHTRADFESVVDEFLKANRLRPLFAEALVQYLEEIESTAESLPTTVQADIADIYSRYG